MNLCSLFYVEGKEWEEDLYLNRRILSGVTS
jgi:hypothetical protein